MVRYGVLLHRVASARPVVLDEAVRDFFDTAMNPDSGSTLDNFIPKEGYKSKDYPGIKTSFQESIFSYSIF
jgi:hypothetical protein